MCQPRVGATCGTCTKFRLRGAIPINGIIGEDADNVKRIDELVQPSHFPFINRGAFIPAYAASIYSRRRTRLQAAAYAADGELRLPAVLLGLLAEPECRAALMLAARGVDEAAVRAAGRS